MADFLCARAGEPGLIMQTADLFQCVCQTGCLPRELHRGRIGKVLALTAHRSLNNSPYQYANVAEYQQGQAGEQNDPRATAS